MKLSDLSLYYIGSIKRFSDNSYPYCRNLFFSEILYPKDGCSPNSGISSELLCRGRDFVVWFVMLKTSLQIFVCKQEVAGIYIFQFTNDTLK